MGAQVGQEIKGRNSKGHPETLGLDSNENVHCLFEVMVSQVCTYVKT